MAKQITKSYLSYLGVTEVTSDGRIFTEKGELKPTVCGRSKNKSLSQERLEIRIHDSEKYKSIPKEKRTTNSGIVRIKVHQAVFAWFNGEVPYGMEIHHRDSNHLNNNIENLVALSPEEHRQIHNLLRESKTEEKCRLDIPREHYVKKIAECESKGIHSNAAQYKRRLRYYDSHIEEAQKLMEQKKDLIELAAWKKLFKEQNNLKMWHECNKVEKCAKENKEEASVIVKHALETIHRHFGKESEDI